MTIPSHVIQMAMLQAVAFNLDDGEGNAYVVYFDDSRPESELSDIDPAAMLVTLNLPNPCVKNLGVNSIELFPSEVGMAVKGGVAVWARLYNATGQAVIDIDVGVEILLDNPNIVLGSTVKLDAIFLEPE